MQDSEVQLVAVLIPLGNTYGEQYVPRYVVPILRCQAQSRSAAAARQMKVSESVPEGIGPCIVTSPDAEYDRVSKLYSNGRPWMEKAYPTREDFIEAVVAETGISAVVTEERVPLEIEIIRGIGPRKADDIASLLGDGTVETLSIADTMDIAGMGDISTKEAARFIAEAKAISVKSAAQTDEE